MARGFIAGVIAGSATVVVVAAAVSLVADRPSAPAPGATEVVAGSDARDGATREAKDTTAEADSTGQAVPTPAPETAPSTDTESAAAGDGAASVSTATGGEVVPGGLPSDDAGEAADSGGARAADPDRPGRRPAPDSTVARADRPDARPAAPAGDDPASTETRPPEMPRADTAPTALPEAPAMSGTPAEVPTSVQDDGPELPSEQAAVPTLPQPGPDAAPAQPPAPAAPAIDSPLAPDPAPGAEQAREAEDDPAAETPAGADAPGGALSDRAEAPEDEDPAPGETEAGDAAREASATRPQIGEPATAPGDRVTSTAGLPRIGDAPDAEASERADPLVANAVSVDVDPDLPRLAVVLIDDGRGPLGPDALQAFPFPVSFAIDPSHPDPADAARAYRALGFEVLAMARLPEGAAPQDVEIALEAALGSVPGAVGVIEPPEGGLQGDRAVAEQVASFLASSGHGLVSVPRGLNAGQQIAARAGVPSVTLFRDFDSEGQDARVIRRFLDQGAFRAGQQGEVVMLGRLRADTISALVLWGLQDRAQSVALVPISVVLRETRDEDG